MPPPEMNYCYEHGLFFVDFCPDCKLEEWDTFTRQKENKPQLTNAL